MQTDPTEELIVPKPKSRFSKRVITSIEEKIGSPFPDDENNCILLEETSEENLITA